MIFGITCGGVTAPCIRAVRPTLAPCVRIGNCSRSAFGWSSTHILSAVPDFPATTLAPPGSLPGVYVLQLHIADQDILAPGDVPSVLVAMTPAALNTNLGDLPPSGSLVVDADAFTVPNLQKAGYES